MHKNYPIISIVHVYFVLVVSALGMGLCVAFIALVRLPSLKVSTLSARVLCVGCCSAWHGSVCGVHCVGAAAESQGVDAATDWSSSLRCLLGKADRQDLSARALLKYTCTDVKCGVCNN